jgi:hypothetical protein
MIEKVLKWRNYKVIIYYITMISHHALIILSCLCTCTCVIIIENIDSGVSFVEYLKSRRLTPRLMDHVLYSIALLDRNQTSATGTTDIDATSALLSLLHSLNNTRTIYMV